MAQRLLALVLTAAVALVGIAPAVDGYRCVLQPGHAARSAAAPCCDHCKSPPMTSIGGPCCERIPATTIVRGPAQERADLRLGPPGFAIAALPMVLTHYLVVEGPIRSNYRSAPPGRRLHDLSSVLRI